MPGSTDERAGSPAVLVRLARLGERHPLLADSLIAAASGTVSLALAVQPPQPGERPFDALGYVLTGAVTLTLVVRRRCPLGAALVYWLLWVVFVAAGYWPVVNAGGALLALYTVAASRSTRLTAVAAVLFAGVWVYAGSSSGQDALLTAIVQSGGWTAVVWRVGYTARQLAERNRRLALFTVELEREQRERAGRVIIDERVRLARELHDVIAHHMAVVSIHAGLAQYVLDGDRQAARNALVVVGEGVGEALREMRRMLNLLHTGPAGDSRDDAGSGGYLPAPGLDRLGELVDRVRAAGVPVEVRVTGPRHPLASGVDLCAYRVVQESLTNVLKHAQGARATVDVLY
ncbi:sensor histidine kinase [Couchioplanes caeruleus]|nr:histidine kinase [Couchioplanes caeruleus]